MSDDQLIRFRMDGDQAIVGQIEEKLVKTRSLLVDAMNSANYKLQRHIQADKLSGQVLKNRTGNLRRSILVETAVWEGNLLVGGVAVGSTAWYGKIHEFGGVFYSEGRRVKGGPALGKLRLRSNSKVVGAPYTIHFPERSFMRTGLADEAESIRASLYAAVAEGLR